MQAIISCLLGFKILFRPESCLKHSYDPAKVDDQQVPACGRLSNEGPYSTHPRHLDREARGLNGPC